jgi:hypothetical protein
VTVALLAEEYLGRASSSTCRPATQRMNFHGCSAVSNEVGAQGMARP